MKKTEVFEKWENIICFSDICCGFTEGISTNNINKKQIVCMITSKMEEAIFRSKEIVNIFFLGATLLNLYRIKGYQALGVFVKIDNMKIPVFVQINPKESIKEYLNDLGNIIVFCQEAEIDEFALKYLEIPDDKKLQVQHMETIQLGNNISNAFLSFNDNNIICKYDENITSTKQIKNYLKCLNDTINKMITNLDGSISSLRYEDEEKCLQWGCGKRIELPKIINLYNIFEEQVNAAPHSIAIIESNNKFTYAALGKLVNSTILTLQKYGLNIGDTVVVKAVQNVYTVASVLALMQLGAIYVPVDQNCNKSRLQYIMDNSGAKLLISTVNEDIEIHTLNKVIVDSSHELYESFPKKGDQDGLYIIYTSGSTGKPKGVMITVKQFYNLFLWYKHSFKIGHNSKFIFATNFSFDASVKNILTPLLCGGTIIFPGDQLYNIGLLIEAIHENEATHINCIPNLFSRIVESCEDISLLSSLEYAILGGEQLKTNNIERWIKDDNFKVQICNVYGPTEATDLSSYYWMDKSKLLEQENIPIGKPIYNRYVYILNKEKRICYPGESGEIYLAGEGVIESYLDTCNNYNSFFHNIYNHEYPIMYRTGDFGKWDEDGNIIFCGRLDNQVKINGKRIELEELEKILCDHPSVKEAVIKMVMECGKEILCAFYSVKEENKSKDSIKHYCEERMPYSVVPSRFIEVKSFPRNDNGKIDKKQLVFHQEEETERLNSAVTVKNSKLMHQIKNIWEEVLNKPVTSFDVAFFELGGSSLDLYKLKVLLEKELNINVELLDFFEYPTICSLAKYLNDQLY